jgi:hypothetical protein
MLKLTRSSLFALALLADPAVAACDSALLFLSELRVQVEKLTECVRNQELTISNQALDINLLRKELDYAKDFQDRHTKDIKKLNDRLFELRIEVYKLQPQKTKPAKK